MVKCEEKYFRFIKFEGNSVSIRVSYLMFTVQHDVDDVALFVALHDARFMFWFSTNPRELMRPQKSFVSLAP